LIILVVLHPETVTVPVRKVVPVFAVTVTASVPLLLPEVGVTVIQLASSVTVHVELEVTDAFWLPDALVKVRLVGETERVQDGSCVTLIILVVLHPETVTVPVRKVAPVFAVTVTVSVPLLLPEVGVTVIQLASSVTAHDELEVTDVF
jgi:hypothetical protein